MNREIKFRFWQPSTKTMQNWDDYLQYGIFEMFKNHDSMPMQFTGLTDKNGKDIYDGDIFHCNGINYVLRFLTLGGAYTVHKISDESDERFLHHCNHQIEIIGNIYENPELLTENK